MPSFINLTRMSALMSASATTGFHGLHLLRIQPWTGTRPHNRRLKPRATIPLGEMPASEGSAWHTAIHRQHVAWGHGRRTLVVAARAPGVVVVLETCLSAGTASPQVLPQLSHPFVK